MHIYIYICIVYILSGTGSLVTLKNKKVSAAGPTRRSLRAKRNLLRVVAKRLCKLYGE